MAYQITEDAADAAAAARHRADDLASFLTRLALSAHLPGYMNELHAEWAFEAYYALAAEMAKIPRPAKSERAA